MGLHPIHRRLGPGPCEQQALGAQLGANWALPSCSLHCCEPRAVQEAGRAGHFHTMHKGSSSKEVWGWQLHQHFILFFCTSTCLQDKMLMPEFNKTITCLPNTQPYQHFKMFLRCCLSASLRLVLKHQKGSWHLLQSVSFPLHRFPEGWANHVCMYSKEYVPKIHKSCDDIKVSA